PDDCSTNATNPSQVGLVSSTGCNIGVPTETIIRPSQTPCGKVKQKFVDTRIKDQFNSLNKQENFQKNHEVGFYEKATIVNGSITQSFISASGPPCSHHVDLPSVSTGITGFGHTHNDYTCKGEGNILVPSPKDIMVFLFKMVKQAGNVYGDYSKAYYFTVTSGGSYMLQYTGSTAPQDLSFDIKKLNKIYDNIFKRITQSDGTISQNDAEKTFARFLKQNVNIDGLEVYKVTADTAEKMEYDPNTKTLVKIPCP
ncbi:hypothetical protein GSF70_12360, partial [Flavobacteriaceae bacterium W22]|nr:hypothetical protein [Flavobacteriaceae bacterium W22]